MRFLKHSLDTEWSQLALLDLAYVVVLLPLVLMLKAPMMLFVLVSVVLIALRDRPASNLILLPMFVFGVLALYLSLYGAFNFVGLSRLKLFLELLVYVLLIVVTLQRLTRTVNLYLLISPFLFLALSLFFYHGITMLAYVVFEIFVLLWLVLTYRMESGIREGFRGAVVMFMYSLPWVVVLFIFFPRISFEHADYGFKGEEISRMGHDGTMYLDGNALLVPSDRIVMEVGFDDGIPAANYLYFRGSVLYVDKRNHWEQLPPSINRGAKNTRPISGKFTRYKVTLYPTQKKWLYLLDMPVATLAKSTMDVDLITTVEKAIEKPQHYTASSTLNRKYPDQLDGATLRAATAYDAEQNPMSYKTAQEIKDKYPSPENRVKAIIELFTAQSLTYSLKPEALDINRTTDSFLFDKRRGYCVHFASSFVNMARMSGIPARVVTGYKSDKSQSLNNYLIVREKDAHAWAELYLHKHWVRYETTATASNIDFEAQAQATALAGEDDKNPIFKKINLYLMYTKYQIETWILSYSYVRQLQLLDYAQKNPMIILALVAFLSALLILGYIVSNYMKRPQYSIDALVVLEPLLKMMEKQGFVREDAESMHQFLLRYFASFPQVTEIKQVDKLYEEIVYSNGNSRDKKRALAKATKNAIRQSRGVSKLNRIHSLVPIVPRP